jgi:hypothetical protein
MDGMCVCRILARVKDDADGDAYNRGTARHDHDDDDAERDDSDERSCRVLLLH